MLRFEANIRCLVNLQDRNDPQYGATGCQRDTAAGFPRARDCTKLGRNLDGCMRWAMAYTREEQTNRRVLTRLPRFCVNSGALSL